MQCNMKAGMQESMKLGVYVESQNKGASVVRMGQLSAVQF